jgi:hypothetical protein
MGVENLAFITSQYMTGLSIDGLSAVAAFHHMLLIICIICGGMA